MSWLERAADRSEAAERARSRRVKQAKEIVTAARRLLYEKGEGFTIQQLAEEAGIALQTFYRYFPSKDELFLAVFETNVTDGVAEHGKVGQAIADPMARLKYYVTAPLESLRDGASAESKVVTHEHFRLQQMFPNEVAETTALYADLLAQTLIEAQERGLAAPLDVKRDAWVINELITTVYHHYAFAEFGDDGPEVLDHLWRFCLAAVGGREPVAPTARPKSTGKRAPAR